MAPLKITFAQMRDMGVRGKTRRNNFLSAWELLAL